MRFAVLSEDALFVDNIIVAKESQKAELENALGRTLMDAAPLDMAIGDFYNGKSWTRNIEGEQVALPVGDNPAVTAVFDILGGAVDVDE
jgi:hypothetical protein